MANTLKDLVNKEINKDTMPDALYWKRKRAAAAFRDYLNELMADDNFKAETFERSLKEMEQKEIPLLLFLLDNHEDRDIKIRVKNNKDLSSINLYKDIMSVFF